MGYDDSINDGEDTVKKIRNGEQVTELSRKKIMQTVLHRTQFIYKGRDIFWSLVKCLCLRSRSRKNRRNYKNYYLYQKAEKKLNHNFDSLSLVRSM